MRVPLRVSCHGSKIAVMRATSALIVWLLIAIWSVSCQTQSQRDAERLRQERDRNSAAFKAGQAAHKIANEAEKLGAEASRKLGESARKAREGWKAQSQKDREEKDPVAPPRRRRRTREPE